MRTAASISAGAPGAVVFGGTSTTEATPPRLDQCHRHRLRLRRRHGLSLHSDRYGFALAGGGTNWGLAQGLGNGRSDAFLAGVYAPHISGRPICPARSLSPITGSRPTASARRPVSTRLPRPELCARVEARYRYGVPVTGFLRRRHALRRGATQASTRRLQRDRSDRRRLRAVLQRGTATDTSSELGARFDNLTMLGGMPLILRGRLAWAHDWASTPALGAAFESLPGSKFTVNGAPPPPNSALTSAGAELVLVRRTGRRSRSSTANSPPARRPMPDQVRWKYSW